MSQEKPNCSAGAAATLRAVPTSCALSHSALVVSLKSGEVVALALPALEKTKLAKENCAVTAVAVVNDAVLYGTKKGAVKAIINGHTLKLSDRHSSPVIKILGVANEHDTDLYTIAASSSVMVWKLIVDQENAAGTLMYVNSLHGPNSAITSGALSPSGEFLSCTAALSNTIHLFKLGKNTQLLFKIRPSEHALHTEWLSDSRWVVVASTNTVYLFSTDDLAPVQKLKTRVPPSTTITATAQCTHHGTAYLMLGCSNGDLVVLKYAKQTLSLHTKTQVAPSLINGICITPTTVVAALGKEERHSRFIIKPEGANEVRAVPINQLLS